MTKTNAMRLLDRAKIPYRTVAYTVDESDLSGQTLARQLGLPPLQVFKTITAKGDKSGVMVFCLPVTMELNLKKAAALTSDKKVELVPVKDLPALTGYIRGGCSPIGMKKHYPTYIEKSAMGLDLLYVNAGRRGLMLQVAPMDLISFIPALPADISQTAHS